MTHRLRSSILILSTVGTFPDPELNLPKYLTTYLIVGSLSNVVGSTHTSLTFTK